MIGQLNGVSGKWPDTGAKSPNWEMSRLAALPPWSRIAISSAPPESRDGGIEGGKMTGALAGSIWKYRIVGRPCTMESRRQREGRLSTDRLQLGKLKHAPRLMEYALACPYVCPIPLESNLRSAARFAYCGTASLSSPRGPLPVSYTHPHSGTPPKLRF